MLDILKHIYFENNLKELHTSIFRSLEIEKYFNKTFKDREYCLEDLRINSSNSIFNFKLLIFDSKQKDYKFTKRIKKNIITVQYEIYNYFKKYILNKIKIFQNVKFSKYNISEIRINKSKIFVTKILQSLKNFTNNKLNLYLIIKSIKISNLKINLKQVFKTLYLFWKSLFFKEGQNIFISFISHKSALLLSNFIAIQLKLIKKRHNFFLNFLKESLDSIINHKHSKIKGIKILIKGRINNTIWSQNWVIQLGKLSLISKDSIIHYSESTSFTLNGTIGIKVWIIEN